MSFAHLQLVNCINRNSPRRPKDLNPTTVRTGADLLRTSPHPRCLIVRHSVYGEIAIENKSHCSHWHKIQPFGSSHRTASFVAALFRETEIDATPARENHPPARTNRRYRKRDGCRAGFARTVYTSVSALARPNSDRLPNSRAERSLKPLQKVEITSHFDGETRTLRHYIVVEYPIPRQCAAMYYPEANFLVPIKLHKQNLSRLKLWRVDSEDMIVTLDRLMTIHTRLQLLLVAR